MAWNFKSHRYAETDVGQMWNFAILGCPKLKKSFLDYVKTGKKYLLSKSFFGKKLFVSKNYSDQYAVIDVGQMWNFAILGCPKMKNPFFGLHKNGKKIFAI